MKLKSTSSLALLVVTGGLLVNTGAGAQGTAPRMTVPSPALPPPGTPGSPIPGKPLPGTPNPAVPAAPTVPDTGALGGIGPGEGGTGGLNGVQSSTGTGASTVPGTIGGKVVPRTMPATTGPGLALVPGMETAPPADIGLSQQIRAQLLTVNPGVANMANDGIAGGAVLSPEALSHVQIGSNRGVVRIQGTVSNELQRQALINQMRHMAGVRSIVDALRIAPATTIVPGTTPVPSFDTPPNLTPQPITPPVTPQPNVTPQP